MTSTTVRPPAPPQAPRTTRTALWPALALAFSTAVVLVWAVAALLSAGHGFDTTDEGFYLLSYRWWDADHRNFTGAAYLYGPVFDLLGHDIAALRVFRLITVLGVHAVFGWSFMRWLRMRRPNAPPARLWEAAGTTAIMAAGGTLYGWLPATPGYNDPVLLGALLGLAAVFAMAACADRGQRAPAWLQFALGAVTVPILLAKWAAMPVVLLVGAAAVISARLRLRGTGWALAGFATALAVLHFAVVPLTVAIPPLVAVNRLLADGSMSFPVLIERYWTTSLPMLRALLLHYGPLLAAGVLAARSVRPVVRALGFAALAVAAGWAITGGGLGGGAVNVLKFVVPFLAVIAYALVTGMAGGMRRYGVLFGTLALLPLVYALGTGNIPLKVSINAFAAWMAVLIGVLTGLPRARALTAAVAATSLVATACVATGGLWRHPYRGVPRGEATAIAPGVPALASVRLDPAAARQYGELRARLASYVDPPGRAIIGFDKMAGIVFLLDGRSVGELWYASNDRARSAIGIAEACADDPWWGARPPLLIFNRPIHPADRAVLDRCGFRIGGNYRLLTRTAGLTVYAPA